MLANPVCSSCNTIVLLCIRFWTSPVVSVVHVIGRQFYDQSRDFCWCRCGRLFVLNCSEYAVDDLLFSPAHRTVALYNSLTYSWWGCMQWYLWYLVRHCCGCGTGYASGSGMLWPHWWYDRQTVVTPSIFTLSDTICDRYQRRQTGSLQTWPRFVESHVGLVRAEEEIVFPKQML